MPTEQWADSPANGDIHQQWSPKHQGPLHQTLHQPTSTLGFFKRLWVPKPHRQVSGSYFG